MNIQDWIQRASGELKKASVSTARLDALVLLEDLLNKDRAQLLAHPELGLSNEQIKELDEKIKRRAAHEPLAYIRGKTEFYGREFIITQAVLEPRPESETIIELLKKLPLNKRPAIADVGTGSGAIGITASLELPTSQVDLIEIDEAAMKVAEKNVIKFATKNKLIKSNLLKDTSKNYDVLLCNLPYVPDSFKINPSAMNEPKIAIFGGQDGLDIYRQLFAQIIASRHKPTYILTESLPPQHKKLVQVAKAAGYSLEKTDDFIQLFAKN